MDVEELQGRNVLVQLSGEPITGVENRNQELEANFKNCVLRTKVSSASEVR